VLSNGLKEFYSTATQTYAAAIGASAAAQAYLRRRGLSEASAQYFQLGVVESPLTGHEQYLGRLAIPYLTRSGAVGMAFRCIAHEDCKPVHKDKYLWPSGLDRRMYNTPAFDVPSPYIAITEGEIDTETAVQDGIPTVGIPGAQAWQSFWRLPFKGYEAVFILRDDDDAGRQMADGIMRDVPQARSVVMTGGDVNSYFLEHGPGSVRARCGLD
jgi:DNA primase